MSLSNLLKTIGKNTKSLSSLDKYDMEILRGHGFQSSVVIPTLAYGGIIRNRILTSSTKCTQFKSLLISSEGATISVKLIRDVTLDAQGTLIPNVYKNMNHNSSITPGTQAYANSTYTAGTVFKQIIIHGDTTAVSEMATGFTELAYDTLICKQNESYFVEIENVDTGEDTAQFINIIGTIFEVDYCEEQEIN